MPRAGRTFEEGRIYHVYNRVGGGWMAWRRRMTDLIPAGAWLLGLPLAYTFVLPSIGERGRYLMPLIPLVIMLGAWAAVEFLHSTRLKRLGRRLESQLNSALSSTLQNLAEGMRRTGRDRSYLLTVALGSCDEVRALLEAAVAFGVLTATEQQATDALADRVCAMLYRLRQRAT